MNPIPVIAILLLTLAFEQAFIGDQVSQSVQPYMANIDTTHQDCGDLAVGCAIGNFFRPVLGGLATVINFFIVLGGLMVYAVPGAPWWISTTVGSGFTITLIWCVVATIRGLK